MHTKANVINVTLFTKSYANFVTNSTLATIKQTKKQEQHLQDVDQNLIHNNNSDSFDYHFAKHFTQKPIPQQCLKIMSFEILSMVKPILSMKTWGNCLVQSEKKKGKNDLPLETQVQMIDCLLLGGVRVMPLYYEIPQFYLALMILIQEKKSHFSNIPKQDSNQNENSFQLIEIWRMIISKTTGGNFQCKIIY